MVIFNSGYKISIFVYIYKSSTCTSTKYLIGETYFPIIRNHVKKKSLPPHPNIVDMWGAFVDPMPCLSDSLTEYPAALPERFNPKGIGRNMTMFLVMKK